MKVWIDLTTKIGEARQIEYCRYSLVLRWSRAEVTKAENISIEVMQIFRICELREK